MLDNVVILFGHWPLVLGVLTVWAIAARTRSIHAYILLVLPGTFVHELSHFLAALLLGGRPASLSIAPKRMQDGRWQLGEVQFVPAWWRSGLIALAPLAGGPLAAGLVAWSALNDPAHLQFLYGGLCGLALQGSFPSRTDWGIALRAPIGPAAVCLLAWAAL